MISTQLVQSGSAPRPLARRRAWSEDDVIGVQGNLAMSYQRLGRHEEALQMKRDVYSGWLKFRGVEHPETIGAANNYASSLVHLQHFEEARALLRKTMPVARRVLGGSNDATIRSSLVYARALYCDAAATQDDLREAVTTLEPTERIARRVLGGAHPLTDAVELRLRESRAALSARETPSPPPGGA